MSRIRVDLEVRQAKSATRRKATYFVLATLGLLIAAVATSRLSASATSSRTPALLTFSSRYGLCLARADGSHRMRLFPNARTRARSASWSPNGRHVALVESRPDAGGKFGVDERVIIAGAAGRFVRTLVDADLVTGAAWSPNGRYVAVATASRGSGITLLTPDGSRQLGLISSDLTLWDPAWAPDSQRVAFDGQVPPFYGTPGIASIRSDRGDLRLVVAGASGPAYSPDGTQLAYVRDGDIYVAAASDGSGAHRLTTAGGSLAPAWSPGGRLIAFARRGAILTVRPDGSGERVVIPARYRAGNPTWRRPAPLPQPNRPNCS